MILFRRSCDSNCWRRGDFWIILTRRWQSPGNKEQKNVFWEIEEKRNFLKKLWNFENILVGWNPNPTKNPKSRKFGFDSGQVWLILEFGLSDPNPEIPQFWGLGRVSEIFWTLYLEVWPDSKNFGVICLLP